MANKFGNDERLRFFIGDVRDRERLYRAVDGIDFVLCLIVLTTIVVKGFITFIIK